MADLRTRAYATLTPAAQARKDKSDEAFVEDQALQAATSSELRRGWETAGLSETANALMTGAAKAYDSGNVEQGKALEAEGVRTLKAAQAWAPSVQNFTDINSIDSAARWAGGALGNVRSSVKPALGGLAGAAIGGLLTRSAKGAQTGAMIGSGLTGYNQMTDEAIGGAMVDPEIRANKSYSDIINAGRVSGAIQAPLEGLVPAMTVGAVAGLGKRALKGGIAAAAGREITREGAGEFGTEFAQDLVGQGTQNYLKDRGVADDLDYQRALNAGAAGAVAGGAMGGIGGAGHAVHGTLGSAADAVTDVTSDPKNTINKISAAAGETLAKGFNHLDDYINNVSVDRDLSALMGGVRPHEADLDGAAFADARRVHADAYAGRVLSQPNLYDPELVKAASDYGQHRDPFVFQGALRGHFDARKQADVDTGIADELNGETKRSKMKTGDVQLTPDDMLDSSGQMIGTQELARQELNTEGRRKAEGVKNAWDQDVGILADLWRKQGVNDGIITATENESDPAKQKAAIAVMSWVARGFKGTDGEIIMPEKMIQAYGKDAQKLVENAYTLAVQQGVVDHEATKDTFTGIKKRVGELAKRYEADADMIFDNMTPVARSKFEQTLESDSRGEFLAKLGPVAKDLRALANGGEITKNHEAALDSWFGPRKNTVLDHFYEEKNADAGLNEASVKAANSDDTDDRHIERSGLSDDAVMGDSDWNSMSRLGTDNASLETTSSHKYEPRSKADEYFDMRDAGHADQWSQRTKEKLAVAEGDATQRSVQQIGMVDRELEKAAEAKGGELTADEIKAIHEKLALEHDKIAAPAALPEGAGPGQKAAHKEAIANYDRRVRGSVARLNRRFKAMRVKSEELAKPGVNFSKQDVADIHQSSRDLRGPNATIQHGVLLFDNGNAKPYVTSAAAILRLVHRVKDGSSESFTEYGGDAHSLYEKLMAGISSMLDADPKFTGRIGYIKYAGSQPTWLKSLDQLHDDFVFGRKEGRPLTVREALMQRDLSRAKLDAKAKEPNVSDKPYTGTDYRDVKQSTKAKAFSLGKLSTNFNAKLTKDERRGIMEATHEFWEVVKGNDTDAIAEASKAVDELFDKYKPKHVKELSESWSPDNDKTPSENTAFAGQDQGDMLLREDDPSKIGEDNPIHRDEHGFLKTDNATMKAANMGSSGSAVKGKVEPGVATKTKKAVERGTLSPKTVIEWLRSSVGKVMSNLREQIENGHLDSAKDAVDRLENLSEMTVARVMALAPDMSEINAERLISRAKNALQRARAIVDAEEGGVSDERVTENGASKEVGQGRSGNLREVGSSSAAERTGHSANTGPVAGEVQRHGRDGVAEGADAVAAWVSKAVKADQKKLTAVIEKMTPEQINKALDVIDSKQFIKNPELDANEVAAFGRLFDTLAEHLPENKDSKQKAEGVASKDEAVEAAKKHILDTVGPNIELSFAKAFRDGGSGSWSKGAVKNAIRLALNGDVLGTAYHESMHEFFDILGKHGGENTQTMLKRVAGNKIILRKLSRLLEGHAEAQAQLSDPEEALAYMYQFWKAGTLSLAPETQSWFQKIEGYIRNTLGMLSDEMKAMKDMAMVDDIFKAFDQGIFADESHRDVMVGVINRDVEKREAIEKAVGEKWNTIVGKAGKYVLSAESVIEAADNKYMTEELRQYNQKTGEAMGGRASYFEAVATKRNQYMNRLETLFKGVDKEDLEVARKALSTKTTPTDPVALKIVEGIRAIQEELFEYSAKKNVARWDDDKNEWVGIEHRKDYYPQVWDVDTLMKNGDAFKAKLLEHHMPELKAIADKANAEIKNGDYAGENTASNEQLTKQTADRQEVTPELVADAILARVLNSGGYVELDESISALGMSPVATSVNRRQLSWIDAKAFDEFKSKDIVNTMTSYVSSMVKRAEHTERFGHGGELTRERADKAVVYEIGGDKLVSDAEKMLPGEIAKWRKAKAKAMSGDVKLFDEPYPTIRSVGEYLYGVREGEAVLKAARAKAVKKLEQSFKAVMALEGTLGADISQNMRAMNSWMMTYQNFRLLSTTLFSSFADVVGLVVNGGELGDAWDGFVSGIREVKLRWGNEKSQDKRALRAETWGTVDAGSFMDALGQTYGSSFLTGTARRMSDQLFKWNGMEGWNRAMRITATSVAERIIRDYKTEGFDHSDKAAVARFEELFGKGFKPEDIKLDADGELDQTDTKNQAAVSKWVNGAILRPNAAQRTIWGSDQHYQMLWHMKQFTYTFQAVILAKVVEQAKLGNYRPAMVMMAGYTPVIIAADAIKEMLIPGDEPPWMKGGLGKFIQHGVDKAGLLGVGQMGYDAFAKDYGAGLAGPAISQLLHVPMDPVAQTTLGALPMGNLARRIAQ